MTVHHARAEEWLPTLAANSVDLILTDPPYFSTGKVAAGDKQWTAAPAFLAWLDGILAECARVLKPNGSLYLFAAPDMAARVEVLTAEHLHVLNSIVWTKPNKPGFDGWKQKTCKESLRQWYAYTERIIFAEHYGSDNTAMAGAGYDGQCDQLRGFLFEPLRAYLAGERDRAGWTTRRVAEVFQQRTGSRTVTGMAGHWFERVQWNLPTAENYAWLRALFSGEYLRREYEDLRREYEDLRRPFQVSAAVPYTDVWDFPTVAPYPGKHPCEKPATLLEHIITASSRPDALVCDAFAGSGAVGQAALRVGRRFIGCEMSDLWAARARRRIESVQQSLFARHEDVS